MKEEVDKLKEARVIKEVYYPEWLANTVVVKNKMGRSERVGWRKKGPQTKQSPTLKGSRP